MANAKVSPSGKLSETFIYSLEDSFAYQTGYGITGVDYTEGLLMGYKYYDKKKVKVRYPFGYGLSYAKFIYDNLTITKTEGDVYVSFDVKNASPIDAKEVVQVYAGYNKAGKNEPIRVLAGYEKAFIEAGKIKTFNIKVNPRAFEYYDVDSDAFVVKNGKYEISVGDNSRNLILKKTVEI